MKLAFLTLVLALGASSAVATTNPFGEIVHPGAPCTQEGRRAYMTVGKDQAVYVCEFGKWTFLYLRTPDDRND